MPMVGGGPRPQDALAARQLVGTGGPTGERVYATRSPADYADLAAAAALAALGLHAAAPGESFEHGTWYVSRGGFQDADGNERSVRVRVHSEPCVNHFGEEYRVYLTPHWAPFSPGEADCGEAEPLPALTGRLITILTALTVSDGCLHVAGDGERAAVVARGPAPGAGP